METGSTTGTENKRVVVVGGGLGGLSAAVSLAQRGYCVDIYEKNDRLGGKLNVLQAEGFRFDLGPSILTLPDLFERLFARSGKVMSDYVSLRPVRPHWRNFFSDGRVIDLVPEKAAMAEQARLAGEEPSDLEAFLDYSGRLYDLVNAGYFEHGLDTAKDFRRFYGLTKFLRFDMFRTMHSGVARHLKSPYLRDIFDFFIKYVGSSAYDAPAFMNCLPTIQFRHDLWYVDGGMHQIARALEKLLRELGAGIHLNSDVTAISKEGARVTGIVVDGTRPVKADIVVSNMEVVPAYRDLLQEPEAFLKELDWLEPSCSGLVLELGLDRQYDQLAHHNFFFSGNQRDHFESVFHKKVLPEDPTIYLVAAGKTDPTVAPPGCEALKILPHIPHLQRDRPLQPEDYAAFKEKILDKLERMGLTHLRQHVVFEHMWTPVDIERQYRSSRGSIYGVVADRRKNFGFKAPKQSERYENLFFTGGSVNPGGGMPMVVLCGQNVAETICRRAHA